MSEDLLQCDAPISVTKYTPSLFLLKVGKDILTIPIAGGDESIPYPKDSLSHYMGTKLLAEKVKFAVFFLLLSKSSNFSYSIHIRESHTLV